MVTDREAANMTIARSLDLIESADRSLAEGAADRERRALDPHYAAPAWTPPPIEETVQRAGSRLGDETMRQQIAQRAAAAQTGDGWNRWFSESLKSQLPLVWDV